MTEERWEGEGNQGSSRKLQRRGEGGKGLPKRAENPDRGPQVRFPVTHSISQTQDQRKTA